MQNPPPHLIKAELIRRTNRFVAEVTIDGAPETVYVPNTGRLSELALPGAELLLSKINGKFRYKILYILSENYPVMIDSTYSNRLFSDLLLEKKVPGLEYHTLLRREPVYGTHRFDFLLENDGEQRFLELKSCTLFHDTVASFPDAVSDRASEHVRLLAETGRGDIIFFVLKEGMKKFLPNYHTDFTFYKTLKKSRGHVKIRALTVRYNNDLLIEGLHEIPVIFPEVRPRGIFLLLLETINPYDSHEYMLLCGKDDTDVFAKIKKMKNRTGIKAVIPGISFNGFKIISDLPVVSENLDLSLIDRCFRESEEPRENIFSSDEWRVYSLRSNPAEKKWFWQMVLHLRFGVN